MESRFENSLFSFSAKEAEERGLEVGHRDLIAIEAAKKTGADAVTEAVLKIVKNHVIGTVHVSDVVRRREGKDEVKPANTANVIENQKVHLGLRNI